MSIALTAHDMPRTVLTHYRRCRPVLRIEPGGPWTERPLWASVFASIGRLQPWPRSATAVIREESFRNSLKLRGGNIPRERRHLPTGEDLLRSRALVEVQRDLSGAVQLLLEPTPSHLELIMSNGSLKIRRLA
jgi:hypothetical protein